MCSACHLYPNMLCKYPRRFWSGLFSTVVSHEKRFKSLAICSSYFQSPFPQVSSSMRISMEAYLVLPPCTPVSPSSQRRFSFDKLPALVVQAKITLWGWIQYKSYVSNLSIYRGTEGRWHKLSCASPPPLPLERKKAKLKEVENKELRSSSDVLAW